MHKFNLSIFIFHTLLFATPIKPLLAQDYKTGLTLLPTSEYENLPAVPRFRAFLPPSADLSAWLPAVGNQGQQSSCTAWSTTYYMRSFYVNRSTNNTDRQQSLSPSFVYNQLARRGSSCSEGLAISRALDFLQNRGAPLLDSFPYALSTCEALPNSNVSEQAGNFRIRDWKRLDRGKLDDIKGEIASGNPVVIAMLLPNSFTAHKGSTIYDDQTVTQNAHAMTVIGYDDNRRAFRLINSWGKEWGDRGYAWVSYRTFQSTVPEMYAARVDFQPPPKPEPPKPAPILVDPPKPQPVFVVEPPKPEPPKPAPILVDPPKPQPVFVVEPPKPEPPKPAPILVDPPKPQPVFVVEPPKPDIVVPPPKPTLTWNEVADQIATIAKEMRCAKIESTLSANSLGVSGFVGDAEDELKLRRLISASGLPIQLNLKHRPWPQCEALLTFSKPIEDSSGLSITTTKISLKEGDALSFNVTTPSYAAYLYVSYLQADGQVVHLQRYADQKNKPLLPGTQLTLGSKGEYRISGPTFGAESIIVVASSVPLIAIDRPQSETEREYLTEFRIASFAQLQAGLKTSAAFLPITTSKY